MERLGLEFPLASDRDGVLVRRYGTFDAENEIAWPSVFVIDRHGQIAWRSPAQSKQIRPTVREILVQFARLTAAD